MFVSYYSKNKESDNIGFTTMDKDFLMLNLGTLMVKWLLHQERME